MNKRQQIEGVALLAVVAFVSLRKMVWAGGAESYDAAKSMDKPTLALATAILVIAGLAIAFIIFVEPAATN